MQKFFARFFSKQTERIEITVETNEFWEMQIVKRTRTFRCPKCEAETVFIPADLGMKIIETDDGKTTNPIAEGTLHTSNLQGEKVLVCLQSLQNILRKKEMKLDGSNKKCSVNREITKRS